MEQVHFSRVEVMAIADCPKCGAKAGRPCWRTKYGAPTFRKALHQERWESIGAKSVAPRFR